MSDLEVYTTPKCPDVQGHIVKDANDNIVTNTLAERKADGGYDNFMTVNCGHNCGCGHFNNPYVHWGQGNENGKGRARHTADHGSITVPETNPRQTLFNDLNTGDWNTWRNNVGHGAGSRKLYGDYKQDYSQTTTTCCATKGIPGTGVPNSVPRKGDWYMSDDAMADTCDRGLYGITDHCQTEFELKIEICNDCSCVSSENPQHKEYVRITNKHDLITKTPGCSSWFIAADAGMRTYVSQVRSRLVGEKSQECAAN